MSSQTRNFTVLPLKMESVVHAPSNGIGKRWRTRLLVVAAAIVSSMLLERNAMSHSQPYSLSVCLLHHLIYSVGVSVPLFYSASLLWARIAGWRFPLNWMWLLLSILVCVIIGTMVSGLIIISLGLHAPEDYVRLTMRNLQICLVLSLIFGISYYLYENLRSELSATMQQLHARQLAEESVRKLAIAAQLASLESRVRPHFLFNTLNSISALIRENPLQAEQMVEHLSALLRFSLDTNQQRTVPLRDEMKLVSDYLEIEKARFGSRLRYEINVPAELNAVAVPPFALQTLVENSVRHAVAMNRAGGMIRVSARAAQDAVILEVSDDGAGFSAEAITTGHGLDNLQARLRALFGVQGKLEIETTGCGAKVVVALPGDSRK